MQDKAVKFADLSRPLATARCSSCKVNPAVRFGIFLCAARVRFGISISSVNLNPPLTYADLYLRGLLGIRGLLGTGFRGFPWPTTSKTLPTPQRLVAHGLAPHQHRGAPVVKTRRAPIALHPGAHIALEGQTPHCFVANSPFVVFA